LDKGPVAHNVLAVGQNVEDKVAPCLKVQSDLLKRFPQIKLFE
jgi:hypothetical protein